MWVVVDSKGIVMSSYPTRAEARKAKGTLEYLIEENFRVESI